jgi:hypothetical protein
MGVPRGVGATQRKVIHMGAAFGLGLGIVIGVVAGFKAGGNYALARQASLIAGEYVGNARRLWGRAGGGVLLFIGVVVLGVVIMIFGS